MLEKNHILQSQKNPKEPNPKNPKPKATSNQKKPKTSVLSGISSRI